MRMAIRPRELWRSALLFFLLVLLWEAGVRLGHVPPYVLPSPSRILLVFFTKLSLFVQHGAVTLAEVALGLTLGTFGGVGVALTVFYVRPLGQALYPLILGSQMVPVFAIAPLLVLWLGYGIWPKAIVAALISFFPIAVNMSDGLRSVGGELVDLLHSLGASEWKIFRLVRLPASLPFLLSGLKVAATLSLVGATIGEWIGAERGLGYFMLYANALLRVDQVFAAILTLTILGVMLFGGVTLLERRFLRWRRRGQLERRQP